MNEFETLNAKIDQLKMIVDSLLMQEMQKEENANGVGEEQFAIPILNDNEETAGCYEIENIAISDTTAAITFANPYYRVGGKTFEGASSASSVELPAIVALKISATESQSPTSTVESYANIAALQEAEADQNYYIFPLYSLDANGSIECDFRIGPKTSMGEY